MPKHQLLCEICREYIGRFDTEEVEEPIRAAMFTSKDPRHGMPAPFRSESLGWEDMRCPYCNNRPFFARGFLLTERGHWSIEGKEFMDAPRAGLDERALIEKRLHERPGRDHDADIRARIDADRVVAYPPPTEAIPLHYGPDAPTPDLEEEPAEVKLESIESEEEQTQAYLDKTPEEKQADIAERIAIDEAEDGGEDDDSGHEREQSEPGSETGAAQGADTT